MSGNNQPGFLAHEKANAPKHDTLLGTVRDVKLANIWNAEVQFPEDAPN